MKFGFQQNDSESLRGRSLDGSFRRSRTGVSPDRSSCISTASKSVSYSRRAVKALKEYSKSLVDIELFSNCLEDWVFERAPSSSTDKDLSFKCPFSIDDLRSLDYALEGVLFQHLFRMPNSHFYSDTCKGEQLLALEDFLQTTINGLWRTFWHKNGPLPFLVSCPRYPGSRFYTVEEAILNGGVKDLCGAAIVAKIDADLQVQWEHVLELALFKPDIAIRSTVALCEAIFYGFHMLLSRTLSKCNAVKSDTVYLLVLDSKFGGVIKFGGDLSKLEIDLHNPYHSAVEWIKHHAQIDVSPIDRIWNKMGNPNWGDLGTLQILMATINSIAQWKGPPRKSIASLAVDHSLRLQKRRMECNGLVPLNANNLSRQGEIVELECNTDHSFKKHDPYLKLNCSEVVLVGDSQGHQGFQVMEVLPDGNFLSYRVVSLEYPSRLLTMHVGVHPSRLEPSWEAMSLWYQVQRQTKVLKTMKQQGILSKYLPEVIASGHILHPGPCTKQNPGDRCDHPWCGTPILVTSPVGESIASVIAREGPLSSEEALRCCRDILTALRSAGLANIQHGDICPENIVRVDSPSSRTGALYVLVAWGRAVLEDRDSPAMNLQFSSIHALQHRKLCPSSDAESLIYLVFFLSGAAMMQQDSIESALKWRESGWSNRVIQQHLGEVSALLKAFSDYVDSLCGTPYPVDYDIWLRRLNRAVSSSDRGKSIELADVCPRLEDVAESSGSLGGAAPFSS